MQSGHNVTLRVIAREGGRSSIPEELMINRGAAAYWIPAFAGMTVSRLCVGGLTSASRRKPTSVRSVLA